MCLDQVFAVHVLLTRFQQGQYKLYITVLSIMFSVRCCEHVVLINLSVVSGSEVYIYLSFCFWSDTLARFLAAPPQKSVLQLKAAPL